MYQTTKRVLRLFQAKERKQILLIAILMLLGGMMESVSVSLILPLITSITDTGGWNASWYAKAICRVFAISDQVSYVETLLILLIGIFILKNVYLLFEYYVQYTFVARERFHLQRDLMRMYIDKPYVFFLNTKSGDIIRIISTDTQQTFYLLAALMMFYTEAVVCVALGVTIFMISPVLAIELAVTLLAEMVTINFVIKPIQQRQGERLRGHNAAAYQWILQSIRGIKSIKVAQKEDYFSSHYNSHAEIVVGAERKYLTISKIPKSLIEAITVSAVLGFMLVMVETGSDLMSIVPQLSAFIVAAVRLLPSASRISVSLNDIAYNEGAMNNVADALAETREDRTAKKEASNGQMGKFQKKVVMEDVSFAYPSSEDTVLDDANFMIAAGQSIGIVGASGVGKTTVVDILLGLLEPQSGRVMVDGADIRENMSGWLQSLAYIPQEIFLVDDTIRANVAFGEGAAADDEMVWNALADAQMDRFVRGLPDGLDTNVGEHGIRLSGGQRQRIGIARALYTNPSILFFDEATSSLDNDTESAIMESIDYLKGRKTLIIIAHRLSTIENCDLVYRVEGGKILACGEESAVV